MRCDELTLTLARDLPPPPAFRPTAVSSAAEMCRLRWMMPDRQPSSDAGSPQKGHHRDLPLPLSGTLQRRRAAAGPRCVCAPGSYAISGWHALPSRWRIVVWSWSCPGKLAVRPSSPPRLRIRAFDLQPSADFPPDSSRFVATAALSAPGQNPVGDTRKPPPNQTETVPNNNGWPISAPGDSGILIPPKTPHTHSRTLARTPLPSPAREMRCCRILSADFSAPPHPDPPPSSLRVRQPPSQPNWGRRQLHAYLSPRPHSAGLLVVNLTSSKGAARLAQGPVPLVRALPQLYICASA